MKDISIRPCSQEDTPTLWTMLMHAAHESDLTTVRSNPDLARYVKGWGREGDLGLIAEQRGRPVAAAWVRLWEKGDRGYGYVAEDVPELAIAVIPKARGQGIGTALVRELLTLAETQFSAVSLSIRANNPALKLYEQEGFVRVAGSEVTNRTGGVSYSMIRRFKLPTSG